MPWGHQQVFFMEIALDFKSFVGRLLPPQAQHWGGGVVSAGEREITAAQTVEVNNKMITKKCVCGYSKLCKTHSKQWSHGSPCSLCIANGLLVDAAVTLLDRPIGQESILSAKIINRCSSLVPLGRVQRWESIVGRFSPERKHFGTTCSDCVSSSDAKSQGGAACEAPQAWQEGTGLWWASGG